MTAAGHMTDRLKTVSQGAGGGDEAGADVSVADVPLILTDMESG